MFIRVLTLRYYRNDVQNVRTGTVRRRALLLKFGAVNPSRCRRKKQRSPTHLSIVLGARRLLASASLSATLMKSLSNNIISTRAYARFRRKCLTESLQCETHLETAF